MSRSRKEEMQALYEELRQKVRSMPPGSNVGAFLDEEVTRLAQRMRENLSEEHAEAASCEADFPPLACPHCQADKIRSLGLKKRKALTIHGEIRFEREVFQCAVCRKSFALVDDELGLNSGRNLDRAVVRKAACAGAFQSFQGASRLLCELGGITVSSAEIQRIVHEQGGRIDSLQREEDALFNAPISPYEDFPEAQNQPEKLVIQGDATCVLTVAKEENKSVYCGTAFALEDRGKQGNRPFVANRAYTASAENMEDFGMRMKAMCWKSGMRYAEAIAFMGDGARPLWKWAEENLPEGTVFIQDYWHVLEHLAKLSKDVFGKQWEGYYKLWKRRLWSGRIHLILKDLRKELGLHPGVKQKRIQEEITYLETGQKRMDYPRFRKEGWPIGSGAVEGTCKHLVKERFNVTGAQWRRSNIQNVLALRLAFFNDEWDQYWKKEAA